ncbi:MAG: HIT domain-containing protein [Actinomycetota bacterium]|nr:HIT domain-containing protein [Actinomycetota bacterium]
MSLDHLWSGWRAAYVAAAGEAAVVRRQTGEGTGGVGEGSLFERILAADVPDSESYVVWRGSACAALLNIYPYTNGHLMVLPRRAVVDVGELSEVEASELWWGIRSAVAAVRAAYSPDGVNVGMNLGEAAGAGIPDHLHVHVLPRWAGDTNFMTAVAQTRVMPEALGDTWSKLRAAWPADGGLGGEGVAGEGDGGVAPAGGGDGSVAGDG